jgi:selenocysteine-specific elongation factor
VVPVSSFTGQGLEELKSLIFRIAEGVQQKNVQNPWRLPADRVFVMEGFGTVITGTLIEGRVSVGDKAAVYPGAREAKIRRLQVHGQNVETAEAGQRVALNLASVKKDEVARGDTLAMPGSMEETLLLDVRLHMLADTTRSVGNGAVLHLYHGTRHTLCKLLLLDKDSLKAGENGLAQLRLDAPIAAKYKDHFVVRFYSPMETVGGGVILEANPVRHKRRDTAVLEGLVVKETGSFAERVEQAVRENSPQLPSVEWISRRLFVGQDELRKAIVQAPDIVRITDTIIVHESYLAELQKKLAHILAEYHAKNPLQAGMRRDELHGRLLPRAETVTWNRMLDLFEQRGLIRLEDMSVALIDFSVQYTDTQKRILEDVEQIYSRGAYAVPNLDDVQAKFPANRKDFLQVVQSMLDNGVLVRISPQILLHRDHYNGALQALREIQAEEDVIELGTFRDKLATSRKYAYALLEYCDQKKITRKTGDLRWLNGMDFRT